MKTDDGKLLGSFYQIERTPLRNVRRLKLTTVEYKRQIDPILPSANAYDPETLDIVRKSRG